MICFYNPLFVDVLILDPAFWYEDYPIALIGRRQSPINIATERCILNNKQMELSPGLTLSYPSLFSGLKVRNPKDDTYFGWRVDVPYDFGDQTGACFSTREASCSFLNSSLYISSAWRRTTQPSLQVGAIPWSLGEKLLVWFRAYYRRETLLCWGEFMFYQKHYCTCIAHGWPNWLANWLPSAYSFTLFIGIVNSIPRHDKLQFPKTDSPWLPFSSKRRKTLSPVPNWSPLKQFATWWLPSSIKVLPRPSRSHWTYSSSFLRIVLIGPT